jgi:nitroimidazol reductase NimA-like FMN-containing flavoprotein (pyridoxamine 5'-phosphate oxidase superfamily)
VWFVVEDDHWYVCTAPGSVKARNLGQNPHVALALEDGNQPYIVEGEARTVTATPAVARRFKTKYDWDITAEAYYTQVLEVSVRRRVMGP